MIFSSIEEIKEYYGFQTDDISEIRKEIISSLSIIHPDKNGGDFSNKKQEKDYEELNAALEFIDNSKKDITISKNDWSLVLRRLDELALIKRNANEVSESQYIESLSNSVNTSIISYQKRHSFLKISSLAISSFLTIMWAFPTIAESHPILKNYINSKSPFFTGLWLEAVLLTAVIWVITKNNEGKDDQIKKTYNLDSTQNIIFKLFIAWLTKLNHKTREYDHENHTHISFFSKDDLINFIANYYEELRYKFSDLIISDSQFDIERAVSKEYENDNEVFLRKRKMKTNPFRLFFKKPGEIDIDLGQKLADTIVAKLLLRGIITISDRKTFSETYRYEYKYI